MGTKELMTIKEVMDYFSISQRTLYNWDTNGTLKRVKVNGRVYYRRSEVESFAK